MKSKKKPLGTKAQIRASKEKEGRLVRAIFLVFILLIVVFSSYFTYNFLNQPQNQTTNPASSQLKAAIVDHLSLTFPNQTFIQTATNTLKQAGYTVDYYAGEKVTVEFYKNLPTHGYGLIVVRVHSTTGGYPAVALFTSETYSKSKYVYEQLTDKLVPVSYSSEEASKGIGYFGINPPFVTSSMNGKFANTIIVMMGCEGLSNTKMAEAFVKKGAQAYISWNSSISASHTDQATICLLQHLITEEQTINQAIDNTMKEVGPDPSYKSVLLYYPSKVGEQTIENIKR